LDKALDNLALKMKVKYSMVQFRLCCFYKQTKCKVPLSLKLSSLTCNRKALYGQAEKITDNPDNLRTSAKLSLSAFRYLHTWVMSVPRGLLAPFRTSVSGSEGCPLFPAQVPSGNSQPARGKW
jgi:hypothetical protein